MNTSFPFGFLQRVLLVSALLTATTGATAAEENVPPLGAAVPVIVDPDVDEFEGEEDEYALPAVRDPFERYNRTIFKFNDGVFRHVVRPFTRGYETITPKVMRRGLTSFFDNVQFPVRFTSCLLQGKLERAAAETGKFVVNSTAGVGGFIKVSDRFPRLTVPEEDFGQVLGAWGVPSGPFLVLPVLGPANPRELFGRVGDYLLTPTAWGGDFAIVPEEWRFMDDITWEVSLGVGLLETMNQFPALVATYDSLSKAALDPYVSFRNGYTQYREAAISK